jgi:hypothetical protein
MRLRLIRPLGKAFNPASRAPSLKRTALTPIKVKLGRMSALRQFRCFTGFLSMRSHKFGAAGI